MTAFLVNQTKSYTLAVNAETGELRLELSDELKENLTEMASDAETNADVFAGVLDLMGEDAGAYIAAMDEMIGAGGTLADAYAEGGTGAVMEMIAGMTHDAFESSAGLVDRAKAGDIFDNFTEVAGEKLDDMMDWGMPSFNPFADPESEEAKAAIEAAIGEEGTYMPGWVVPAGIIVVVGAVGYFVAKEYEEKMKEDVNHIPADPNEPGFDMAEWLERPWNAESLDPTFGETMPSDPDSDPNEGHLYGPTKDYDPEEELEREILPDLEAEEQNYTAEQVIEAAEFHVTTTTMPVEPDFEFKPDFGKGPDLGGGEDFQEGADGIIYITHGDGGIKANPVAAVVEPAPEAAETNVEEPQVAVDHFEFM